MSKNSVPWILQRWVSPRLPKEHIFISPENRPKGLYNIIRVYFRKWFVHPIKRRLAKYYLFFLKKFFGLKVVAVTGSVGKTTTKEMIASVLSQKYKTVSSLANIDPVYNIPSTILRATPKTQMLVLELGIEFPQEMDFYLWLAKPDVGVLTSIYWTHTQFLGNIDEVARQKGELIKAVGKNGWAILNADDIRVRSLNSKTAAQILFYGINKVAQVRAENIKITKDFKTSFTLRIGRNLKQIKLPILGEHFVWAALAAAAIGFTQKISINQIKEGLEGVKPQPHRMAPVQAKSGAILLDDTYNSNPLGGKAAIDTLVNVGRGKTKIAVLGDMLELGIYEERGHREVGEWAATRGIDWLITVGEVAKFIGKGAERARFPQKHIVYANEASFAKERIKPFLKTGNIILFKASRKLQLERLVEECKNIT